MKFLYKYPQQKYPYRDLIDTNRRRGRDEPEYELIDTGVFDGDRYFDLQVEYAKAAPHDILIEISIANRGPEAATIHVLPTLWFRNTWAWWPGPAKAVAAATAASNGVATIAAVARRARRLVSLVRRRPAAAVHRKRDQQRADIRDAQHHPLCQGWDRRICRRRPRRTPSIPSRPAPRRQRIIGWTSPAGRPQTIRLRLPPACQTYRRPAFGSGFGQIIEARRREADEFYRSLTPAGVGDDAARIMRQALAGMLWSKQYLFLRRRQMARKSTAPTRCSLDPAGAQPRMVPHDRPTMSSRCRTNGNIRGLPRGTWRFMRSPCRRSTSTFAKQQLYLLLDSVYLHPTGQIPAYEWNFSDVNPPVQAWAAIFLYRIGAGGARRHRSRFPEAGVRQAVGEFRLVGQSQGPLRQECLRRRVSRARQYRRVRPQRAVADRRLSRAGRRHRMDGAVLPEHARNRLRAGGARPDLRGAGVEFRDAVRADRPRHERDRTRRHVGRGGRILL